MEQIKKINLKTIDTDNAFSLFYLVCKLEIE